MPHNQESTNTLIARLAKGEESAFDELYDAYSPLIFRIAYRIMNDRQEAEDICQEIFLDVIQAPSQFDSRRGSLAAWLSVKTKNKCIDVLRKKQRLVCQEEVEPKEAVPVNRNPTLDTVLSRAEQEAVRQAMLHIPDAQRQAVYATYYEQHTNRELSDQLQRPLGTVKSLIRYGLKNMKKQLSQWEWKRSSGGVGKQ